MYILDNCVQRDCGYLKNSRIRLSLDIVNKNESRTHTRDSNDGSII